MNTLKLLIFSCFLLTSRDLPAWAADALGPVEAVHQRYQSEYQNAGEARDRAVQDLMSKTSNPSEISNKLTELDRRYQNEVEEISLKRVTDLAEAQKKQNELERAPGASTPQGAAQGAVTASATNSGGSSSGFLGPVLDGSHIPRELDFSGPNRAPASQVKITP